MFVRRSRTPRASAGAFRPSGHDPVVTKNGASNGAVLFCQCALLRNSTRETDPPDYNSHHADSDAKIGCRPDRTGDNPDDASADDPERNEIADVAHLDTYPSGPFARSGHGCFNAIVLVDLCILDPAKAALALDETFRIILHPNPKPACAEIPGWFDVIVDEVEPARQLLAGDAVDIRAHHLVGGDVRIQVQKNVIVAIVSHSWPALQPFVDQSATIH